MYENSWEKIQGQNTNLADDKFRIAELCALGRHVCRAAKRQQLVPDIIELVSSTDALGSDTHCVGGLVRFRIQLVRFQDQKLK